jgi:hypothetical protein
MSIAFERRTAQLPYKARVSIAGRGRTLKGSGLYSEQPRLLRRRKPQPVPAFVDRRVTSVPPSRAQEAEKHVWRMFGRRCIVHTAGAVSGTPQGPPGGEPGAGPGMLCLCLSVPRVVSQRMRVSAMAPVLCVRMRALQRDGLYPR